MELALTLSSLCEGLALTFSIYTCTWLEWEVLCASVRDGVMTCYDVLLVNIVP